MAGLIFPDDGTAPARSAAQVPHPEPGTGQGLPCLAVHFLDDDGTQRRVLKRQHLPPTALDETFLGGRVLDGIAIRCFQLGHLVPAVFHIFQPDDAVFIGVIGTQIPQVSGVCLVTGIPDLEFSALQRVAGDAVDLTDLQAGFLVILKVHICIPVGPQRHQLAVCIQQIGLRHALFRHLIHAGQQVLDPGSTIRARLYFVHPVAIHGPHFEDGARHRLAGVCVPLVDRQVGPLIVLDHQGAGLTRIKLYLVFLGVDDVVRRGGRLLHRVDARLQITHQDLACLVGGAVQVMGPVLHFGNAEGDASQGRAICAQLHKAQGGLDAVGEHKFPCLPRL